MTKRSGKVGEGLPVTLSELAFDLTTKDGQALEETVVRLLQRGPSGLQTVLRACSDPACEKPVKRAVATASARVAEAFAALPAKARQGEGGMLLGLLRPEVLESKGHELLGRGAEPVARQFAAVLAATEGFRGAARGLETACALRAGHLEEAVALTLEGDREAGPAAVALLLVQGRRFEEATEALERALGWGSPGAAGEILAALLEVVPAEDPDGVVAATIDRLAGAGGPSAAAVPEGLVDLARGAAAQRLRLAHEEAVEGAGAVEGALRALGDACLRVEEAARQGSVNWVDLAPQAGLGTALRGAVRRLAETVRPHAPPGGAPADLRAVASEAAAAVGAGVAVEPGEPVPVWTDPWAAATALRWLLAEASGVAGESRLVIRPEAVGQWAALTIGPEAESETAAFHPALSGPGAGIPVGPARSFRAPRRLLRALGGDVFWAPGGKDEVADGGGAAERWVVRMVLPTARPETSSHRAAAATGDGIPRAGAADLDGLAGEVAAVLSSPRPGRAFAAAMRAAEETLTARVAGDLVGLVLAETPGFEEAVGTVVAGLRQAPAGGRGGPEDAARAAGSARRRLLAMLTYLGRNGAPTFAYGDLNEAVSTAVAEVEAVARGTGAGLVFLPATGLPRLNLERGRVVAAVAALAEEAVRAGGRGGEVRVGLAYKADEAVAELRLESPMPTSFSGLAIGLAKQVAAGHGGTLATAIGLGTEVTVGFVVSEEERRLAQSLPGYRRLSDEARRALRTAEAVASTEGTAGDPGLRPFLWLKAVEMDVKARIIGALKRHLFLPAALDTLERGRARLTRDGEARLTAVVAALPGEDSQVLRGRLVTAAEAVAGDRLERVTGDLRALAVFIAAYGLPGAGRDPTAAVARALYALGGLPPGDASTIEAARAALDALLNLDVR